ncbi:MAG: hypothetical protein ACLQPN_22610, partial [Bryobacteraceae bacterium]
ALDSALRKHVADAAKALVVEHQKASEAMLQAIKEMGSRIHQLTTAGHMPSRGTPVTLPTVEKWISTAHTYTATYLVSPSTTGSAPKASAGTGTKGTKD